MPIVAGSTSALAEASGSAPTSSEPPEAVEPWPPADAAGGSVDPAVADLLRRHWSTSLELDPLGATELGIHRFDDRVDDNSPEGYARQRALGRGFLAEARGLLGRAELAAADRTSLTLLAETLESDLAAEVCAFEDWSLSAASNPLTRWNRLPEAHGVGSLENGQALVARYAQIAAHVDHEIEHLRSGLARGLVSNTESTRRVIEMFEKQLAQPLEQWPLLVPARAAHPSWPAAERQRYEGRLRELVSQQIQPAFARYLGLLRAEIPGHHVQIALAQELGELPAFRKHWAPTAFVEGWALYTERLADELGLYETDLDRIGLLSFDAWRASRLVVDTGIHAFGWSRQRAIAFMLAHTALSADNIGNEVDRYIVWPGQALAYKLGQLEILALRELAQQKLGPRFDLRAFHAALLEAGGVSLPMLRATIKSYIERVARGS